MVVMAILISLALVVPDRDGCPADRNIPIPRTVYKYPPGVVDRGVGRHPHVAWTPPPADLRGRRRETVAGRRSQAAAPPPPIGGHSRRHPYDLRVLTVATRRGHTAARHGAACSLASQPSRRQSGSRASHQGRKVDKCHIYAHLTSSCHHRAAAS